MNESIYAINIAQLILKLEYQKNKFLDAHERVFNLCYCRKEILVNYVNACQVLIMRIAAKTVKFEEDGNAEIALDISDYKKWFFETAYDTLLDNPTVSNKMITLFKLLQTLIDESFFEYFIKKYSIVINKKKNRELSCAEFRKDIADLFTKMSHWFEVAFFNIITIQINCANLSDNILSNYGVPIDGFCKNERYEILCQDCERTDLCKSQCLLHTSVGKNESLHLYMTEEMIKTKNWVLNFLDIFLMFHTKVNEIELIMDFKLVDEGMDIFCEDCMDILMAASKNFKNLIIMNSEHIQFTHKECLDLFNTLENVRIK